MIQAAKATAHVLLLAAVCLPVFPNIPRSSLVAENSHQGVADTALTLHRAESAANTLIATGFGGCLYDAGIRPCCSSKERDAETGLDYFGARYMSSAQGRFTSPDPKMFPDAVYDPQSWNKYGYVRNNPLRLVDPNGEDWKDVASGFMNAFNTNQVLGIGRTQGGNSDFRNGQAFGDAVSTIQGVAEMLVGGGGEAGGLALDATGVGAVAGVPLNIASAGVIAHGASVAGVGLKNLGTTAFAVMQEDGGSGPNRNSGGSRTEPQLPDKTVVQQDGVTVKHYTRSGDHGPPHLHVEGQGASTRIGQNGKPLRNNPELSSSQQQVIDSNKGTVRKAVDQIMRWFDYNRQQ